VFPVDGLGHMIRNAFQQLGLRLERGMDLIEGDVAEERPALLRLDALLFDEANRVLHDQVGQVALLVRAVVEIVNFRWTGLVT